MSEDEARHTPTPWRVTRRHYKSLPHLVGPNGRYVMNAAPRGTYHRSEVLQVADAEHIVRCVNAHDELVAALRAVETFLMVQGHAGCANSSLFQQVCAALAKARS